MIYIVLILYVAAVVLGLRYYTHMLQLSSYQFQGYFRFLGTQQTKYGLHIGAMLTLMAAGLAPGLGMGDAKVLMLLYALAALFLLFTAFMYIPRPAKKKFVITKRVRRLFITYAVLAVILIVLGILFKKTPADSIICGIFIGLLPLVTALANLINKPIENRINKYFIDDAKRLLNGHPNLRIIGITGSYGKTSVKYYLATLLSEGFSVLMTPESYNTPMGIVRTIREHLKPTHEIFICEMGARHLHDIKEITDIVHPDDGVLTSIGYQHLETFHSLENIISTKYELLDAVDEKGNNGLKFVNGDNEIIRENMKYGDAIVYGTREDSDYRASDIKVSGSGTTFTVSTPSGETAEFSTRLVGQHNVVNIVGAIAAANSLGISMSKLKMAVRRLQSVPHRLELVRHGNVSILDDAYNSNPNGAKVALETLALFEGKVKILVTPGMVELGEKEDEYNAEFGRQAAGVCDYIILVGEKNSASIKRGAEEAGFDADRLFVKRTLDEATRLMYEIDAGREKVILLENDLPDNYK